MNTERLLINQSEILINPPFGARRYFRHDSVPGVPCTAVHATCSQQQVGRQDAQKQSMHMSVKINSHRDACVVARHRRH